jgi:hypothetical protein
MESELLKSLAMWLKSTALSSFVTSGWTWAICETLHFLGLCLLIGAVGILDLRLLGVAKKLPVGPLHQLLPWGILGFALCVTSGVLFVTGEPFLFLERGNFQLKMLFVLLAGINVLIFYVFMFREVEALGPGDDAPIQAKAVAAISVFLWLGVIYWGRLLGFG